MKALVSDKMSKMLKRSRGGFSLVEVTVAIGISSIALLSLVATMPIGMSIAREAMRQTVHSHILQKISGDLNMLPFDELASYSAHIQYYDMDGRLVDNVNEAIFSVQLEPQVPSYPKSNLLDNLQARFERVIVKISRANQSHAEPVRTALTIVNSGL